MSASNIPLLAGATLLTDTAAAAVVVVKASSGVIYELELDNTANAAVTYLRLYNATSATIGSTQYDGLYIVPASVKITVVLPAGVTYGTGICYAATTSATLATTTAPSSSFAIKMVYV